MLPPVGLMVLGSGPESSVAPTVSEETPSGQFADNLLSLTQAAASSSTLPRDPDHKTADAALSVNGLNALPVASELITEDPTSSGNPVAMPLEDYALLPVDPIQDANAPLPVVLPPNGNKLPVTPQTAPNQLEGLIPLVDRLLDRSPGPQTLDDAALGPVVGSPATGPDELGLGIRALDIAHAVQNYGEFIKPNVDTPNSRVNPGPVVPAGEPASLNASASLLLNSISTTPTVSLEASAQTALKPFAASTTEIASSLLAARAAVTIPFAGQPETSVPQSSPGQMLNGLAGQLSQALANQNGQLANVGTTPASVPTPAETVARLTAELMPSASANAGNSATSLQAPGASNEFPGLSPQLPASGTTSVMSERASQASRNTVNLAAPAARNDGLATVAGNPIEVSSAGTPTVTASTQLRAALASMDTRQSSASFENAAPATTTAQAAPVESVDAITPATPASAVTRSTNGAGLLPSGLTPMAPTARLDVSDGMGGQWVGRLSQMIAQQQLTGQSLRIALSPAELGSVELTFSGSADNWAVSLNAQQGQTRELLESHLDRIRSMLQDLGVSDAQVAMADRWTGGEANSQQDGSDPTQARSEQSGGWQHSPTVQSPIADSAKSSPVPSSGVDAYV